jgi:hypothetical protein
MTIEKLRAQFDHAINATPFSEKGRSHLSELGIDLNEYARKNFFKHIYVQPFTTYEISNDDSDGEEEEVFGREKEKEADSKQQKEQFETKLIHREEDVFMMTGTAGSGKTTYLNYLFECVLSRERASELVILDIENTQEVRKILYFCNAVCDLSEDFQSLTGRFMSAIIFQLNRFLEKKNEEKLDDYRTKILGLLIAYSDKFQSDRPNKVPETPRVTEFFDILDKFAISSDSYEEFGKKIKDFVDKNSKLPDKIEIFFLIFLRVLLCQQQNESAKSRLSYVVAIDNIERLIDEDSNDPIVIQEQDLKGALKAVQDAVRETNDILNIPLRRSVIIIFSVRDTTVKLSTTLQQIDENNDALKISQWFDAQEIYERKFNAYLPKETQEKIRNDILFKAFNTIMNDKRSIRGLYHVLSNMYNHNKRRLPQILRDIILTNGNTDVVKEYLEWWNIASSKKGTAHIRYLCRKAILRLFYNRYDLRDLFKKFGVDREGNRGDYATYARKVLTYLYQNNPTNNMNDAENYITLQKLVKDVIKPANASDFTGIRRNDLPQLAKMLYLMTDIMMLPHNWSPLVEIISADNIPFTESSLLEALTDLKNNCREYKIKITDAGRSYALLNADFEYFACRYYYVRRWPLLFSATTQKNDNDYLCLDIIRNVRKNAEDCIKKIIDLDGQFFQTAENQNMYTQMLDRKLLFLGKPHPVRIARLHVGYLEAYKRFIDQDAKLDNNTKNEISTGISNEIRNYVKAISELLEVNRTDPIKHFEAPFDNINGWIAQAQQQYLDVERTEGGK